ncbi:hypothetical protein [Vulcanisaeta sp. JCM 16159]|uniref:hypothetical protein n=1 Tax=Vulcanisaeta sp. JCM 16159 TaxID=1295371 RepID=UPI0006D173A2|nr:hypothetical protein [Vulcanisaeta sp. JCM 16159]
MLLKAYQTVNRGLRGLILMILAHTYMDSFTWCMDNAIALTLISPSLIIPLSTAYFTSVVLLSALIFITGFKALNNAEYHD